MNKNFVKLVWGFFKENFKVIFKHILYILLLFSISILLMLCFPDRSNSINGIFSWIIIGYLMVIYFRIMPNFFKRKDISSLENRLSKESKLSLYEWLGADTIQEITVYKWLKDPEENDIVKNLKAIKECISSNVGNNISDYYLLKKYLEYHSKNNFMNSIWKSIGPIIFASIGGLLVKLGLLDWIYSYFLSKSEQSNMFEHIEKAVQVGVVSLFIFIVIIYIKSEFTQEKRRIDLLINTVEAIIKEKEE